MCAFFLFFYKHKICNRYDLLIKKICIFVCNTMLTLTFNYYGNL